MFVELTWIGTGHCFLGCFALGKNKGRHNRNLELGCGIPVFVHVNLAERDTVHFVRQFLVYRLDRFAGRALEARGNWDGDESVHEA